jgi:hypothetical protein
MAKLSNQEFYDKWVPLLADNVFQDIDGKRFEQLLADLRDSFASTADLSAQPVAPAVNFDPVLRQLTATHLLGAAELEYNRNNGGFTAYAPVQVDDLGHGQGEWRFRVKGAAGRNASQTTDSPLIDVKGTLNPAGPGKIKSTDISDSTEAGRALLTAKDVAALRTLLDQLGYRAEQYGKGQPKFDTLFGEEGALVYLLRNAAGQSAPVAPTNVEVDDTSDTLSGILVPGYPAVADYEVFGSVDFPGVVNASVAGADIQNGRIISRGLKGNILAGGAGIRVAANGSHPAGAWMLNDKAFTGVITPAPTVPTGDTVSPTITFIVPAAGATLKTGDQVLLTANATDNVAVTGVTFTNGATGAVLGQGAKNGNLYTLPYTILAATGLLTLSATATDAAGNSQTATVSVNVQAATPIAVKATAPVFGSIDDVNNIVTLTSNYAYTEIRWGIEGQGVQVLAGNSICSPGNIAGRLYGYVVADAATNRLQSDTVYSAAFSLNATANNAPSITLESPQQGKTIPVGDPVVLNALPQDADGQQDIKRVDHLDNGVKFAETTGFPHTVQRTITAGAHSFTARVYDMLGAQGLSNAVQITGQVKGTKVAKIYLMIGQSPDSGLSPRSELPAQYYFSDPRIKSWDYTTRRIDTYSLGKINPATGAPYSMQQALDAGDITLGANDHSITKLLVPGYDNGVGSDPALLNEWRQDPANAGQEIFLFKKDLTPPVSTDGASAKAWMDGVGGREPLMVGLNQEWAAFDQELTAQGYGEKEVIFISGLGEQDSYDYLNTGSSGPNPDFAGSLTRWRNQLIAAGILKATSRTIIVQKQRPNNVDAKIAAAQAAFVASLGSIATLITLVNPQFLDRDLTHYKTPTACQLGVDEYTAISGRTKAPSNADYPISGAGLTWNGLNFATKSGALAKSGSNYGAGSGGFGVNLGLADTCLLANQAGSIKFNLVNSAGVGAVLGWHTSPVLTSVFEAAYAFLVYDGDNTISVYNAGNTPFVGLPATFGYQYRLNRDLQMFITIQASVNGIDWKPIAKFAQPDNRALYPVTDVLGGHELQIPQAEGHVAYGPGGGSTPPTQGVANPAVFAVDATTTNANGYYTTSRRDGAWANQAMLGDKGLAANTPGIVYQSYDGTRGVLSLIGLVPAGTRVSGAKFYAGIYLEPAGTGHNVMAVYFDGTALSAVVMGVAVAGWDYGVQHDAANGFGLVKRITGDTGAWAAVGNYNFGVPIYTEALTAQATLLGAANASLWRPQYDGAFA